MEAARDRPLHPRANVLKGFFWSPGFFYDFCARNLVDFCVWASQQKNKNLIEKPHKTYGQTEKKHMKSIKMSSFDQRNPRIDGM